MAEAFESFLSEVLAPPTRDPDRAFVAKVQARMALEQGMEAQRRALFGKFFRDLLGIAAVAAGLIVMGGSPELLAFASESPGAVLAIVAILFSFLLLVIGRGGPRSADAGADPALFNHLARLRS